MKRILLALAVAALGLWLANATPPVRPYPVVSSAALDPRQQPVVPAGQDYPRRLPD